METSLPTPMTARVYVNLPEGILKPYILLKRADQTTLKRRGAKESHISCSEAEEEHELLGSSW